MPVLEPNFYATWVGKQTAKGTPNVAPSKRLKHVSGALNFARDDGSEEFSDLTKYGDKTDWVNSLTGAGELGIEGTPEETAYLMWLFSGGETVSTVPLVTGPPAVPAMSRHRFTPATARGHWFTTMTRIGSTVIQRRTFADNIITKMTFEASTANKALRVTPRILSLDPGAVYTADPAAAMPTARPFLHTDLSVGAAAVGDGGLTIDGTLFRAVSNERLEIDDAWEPWYGDNTIPADFVQGNPSVNVGATLLLDTDGLAQFNKLAYGTPTPTAGMKPLRSIPALGSFRMNLKQRDAVGAFQGLAFDATVPGVKWTLPDAPAPNPAGGAVEIALAGEMRPVAGQQAYTVDLDLPTGVVAFTV